jgi:hypothetical protein
LANYVNLSSLYDDTPTAEWGQQINDNFAYVVESRPFIKLNYALQNVADSTVTTLTPSLSGSSDLWDGSAFTIPSGLEGFYMVTVNVGSVARTEGDDSRSVRLLQNTDTVAKRRGARSLNGTFHTVLTTVVSAAGGDTFDVTAYQDTGTTMSFFGSLTAYLVAPS